MQQSRIITALWIASIVLTVLITRSVLSRVVVDTASPLVLETLPLVEGPGPALAYRPERLILDADEQDADAFNREAEPYGEQWPGEDEADVPRPGPLEVHEMLGMALQSTDLVNRNLVIAHLLAQLTPENVGEALRAFEDAPRSEHTDHSYRLFLHAWAKMDGEAALDYLYHQPGAHRVGGGEHWAMSGWSQDDPAAALTYVESQDAKRLGRLYPGLVRGWVRTDLAAVRSHVEELEDPGLRKRMVGVLARGTLEDHGGRAALDWVDRSTAKWGRDDPEFLSSVFDGVFGQLKPEHAPEAAAWIDENLEHPDLEDWVFQKVSRDYVREDANGAVDWVESYRLGGNERFNYGVIGNFAGSWAKDDPYTAIDWANNMDMPSRRSSAYSQIAMRWAENDIENAEAWLAEGENDPLMDDARRRYSQRIAPEDPARALEYAVKIKRDDYREESMVNAASILFERNPEAVVAWLPFSGLGGEAQSKIIYQGGGEHRFKGFKGRPN
ncbi:MAG: hypothetical protein VCG02_02295 [Verrucomicrobiota bacterium]